MPGRKQFTAFTSDGEIAKDDKAHVKNDFLISDKYSWLCPPLRPTKTYGWVEEMRPIQLLGTEYVLTNAPAPPEYNAPLIAQLAKLWEEALAGIKVAPGRISDAFKLQMVVAAAGIGAFALAMGIWFAVSQSYQIPVEPGPVNNILQEAPVES